MVDEAVAADDAADVAAGHATAVQGSHLEGQN